MMLKELFDSGKFVVTSEVGALKGTDVSEMMEGFISKPPGGQLFPQL